MNDFTPPRDEDTKATFVNQAGQRAEVIVRNGYFWDEANNVWVNCKTVVGDFIES